MSVKDADLLETILLDPTYRAGDRLRVLEWGAGKSTLYFAKMLQAHNAAFEWTSLEHDRQYFEGYLAPRIQQEIDFPVEVTFCDHGKTTPFASWNTTGPDTQRLNMVFFDYGILKPSARPEDRVVNMDDYVSYPAGLGQTFDLILVDGRKRRRCLLEALQIAGERSIVFCHDAHRNYYHCAYQAYPYHRLVGDWLWIGTKSPATLAQVSAAHAKSFGISRFFSIHSYRG